MGRTAQTPDSRDGAVQLRVLVPLLLAFAAALYALVGLPHAPDRALGIPDGATLEALLRSQHPPLDGLIYVIGVLSRCKGTISGLLVPLPDDSRAGVR